MKQVSSFSLIFLTVFCLVNSSLQLLDDLELRLDGYFEELMADPYYQQPALKLEVEKLFEEYKNYIKNGPLGEVQSAISNSTAEFLDMFEEIMTVPAPFPTVIQLFTTPDSSVVCAVSLEIHDDPQSTILMELVLREYDEVQESWIIRDSMFVKNSAQLEVENIDGYIFIFLSAQNIIADQQINVYSISNSKFIFVQTFSIGQTDHFTVWNEPNSNNFYLGVVSSVYSDHITCSLYVYQWTNDNFALFDIIPTFCATAVKSFNVDSAVFLAVCHGSSILDKTRVAKHTTLYKFDDETKSFHVHQQIPVSDCMNIEYFNFKSSDDLTSEHFVIIVSHDEGQRSSTSIAYKFHYEYFYPFQLFNVNDVHQWLAYESLDQQFLLAVTKYSGLRLFHFDGKVFTEASIFVEANFINHISKCSIDGATVLVIADRRNDGTHPNVFHILYTDVNLIDEMEDVFNEWHTGIANQLKHTSQLDYLEEMFLSAPRVDSPKIFINGTLELTSFDNDTLVLVQSSQNSLNDTREDKFAEDLENKLAELKMIESFVHKLVSSNGKFIVNGDLFLNDFAVNCTEECDLNILSISNLNGEDFDDLVANTINIDNPNSFDASLDFENIAVSLHLLPERINHHPISSLVHRKRDLLFRNGLKVDSIIVSEKLNVNGLIDGVKVEPNSVLLASGDQTLNGTLMFEKGSIDELYYHRSSMNSTKSCFGDNQNSELISKSQH